MDNVKYTLGPWMLSENINDTQDQAFTEYCVEDENGEIIGFYRDRTRARLIAAAPKLLAALELCERALEERDTEAETHAAKSARAILAEIKEE